MNRFNMVSVRKCAEFQYSRHLLIKIMYMRGCGENDTLMTKFDPMLITYILDKVVLTGIFLPFRLNKFWFWNRKYQPMW